MGACGLRRLAAAPGPHLLPARFKLPSPDKGASLQYQPDGLDRHDDGQGEEDDHPEIAHHLQLHKQRGARETIVNFMISAKCKLQR